MGGVAPGEESGGDMDRLGAAQQRHQTSGEMVGSVEIGGTQTAQSRPSRRLVVGMAPGEDEIKVVDPPRPTAGRQHLAAPGEDRFDRSDVMRVHPLSEHQSPIAEMQPFTGLLHLSQSRAELPPPAYRSPMLEQIHRAPPSVGLLPSLTISGNSQNQHRAGRDGLRTSNEPVRSACD